MEYTPFARKWILTRRLLEAKLEAATAHQARFLLVYIPESLEGPVEPAEVILGTWSAERNVPFLDLRAVFLDMPPEDRKRLSDVHWTPLGHWVVARAIAAEVHRRKLLP